MVKKEVVCKLCGGPHYKTWCFYAAKKRPKQIGKETIKWMETRAGWIEANPGPWECYLQIHPWCPIKLSLESLTLDHIKGRGSHAKLRHDLSNLKPACIFCNGYKESKVG